GLLVLRLGQVRGAVGVLLGDLGAGLGARVVVLLHLRERFGQHVAGRRVLGLGVLPRLDRVRRAERELRGRDLLLGSQLLRQPLLLRLRFLLLGAHLLREALLVGGGGLARLEVLLQ